MKRTEKPSKAVDKRDLGTVEAHRRLTSDPLLSSTIEPHRLQHSLALRAALDESLSAPGLDMVRVGMVGGALNGERSIIPTTPANIEHRTCHQRRIGYILPELHPCKRPNLKTYEPFPYSAVNPRCCDPTSDEAVAYRAMLEDIANIAQLRQENAALVDRGTDVKADIDLLTAQFAKVPSWER